MTEKKTTPETEAAHVPATSAEGGNPATEPSAADKDADNDADKGADKVGVTSKVWMGTAVGVGSAALVAALMYAKRRK